MTHPVIPQDSKEFPWAEVAVMLIKSSGITSGLWHVGARFGFAAINAGPVPAEVVPTAVVGLQSVILSPAEAPGPLVFDAAELNKPPVGVVSASPHAGGGHARSAVEKGASKPRAGKRS